MMTEALKDLSLTDDDVKDTFWLSQIENIRFESTYPKAILIFEGQCLRRREAAIETFHIRLRQLTRINRLSSPPVTQCPTGRTKASNLHWSFSITVDHCNERARIGPVGWVGMLEWKFAGLGLGSWCFRKLLAKCSEEGLGDYGMEPISLSDRDGSVRSQENAEDREELEKNRIRRNRLYRSFGYKVDDAKNDGQIATHLKLGEASIIKAAHKHEHALPSTVKEEGIALLKPPGKSEIPSNLDATNFIEKYYP